MLLFAERERRATRTPIGSCMKRPKTSALRLSLSRMGGRLGKYSLTGSSLAIAGAMSVGTFLKHKLLDRWRSEHCDRERTTFYVGLD